MLVVFFGYPIFLFMTMRMFLSMDAMKTTGQLLCNASVVYTSNGTAMEVREKLSPIGNDFQIKGLACKILTFLNYLFGSLTSNR